MQLSGQQASDDAASALRHLIEAQTLAPQLVAVAQAQYDAWDETDVDTFAGGGICHLIADELVRVLDAAGVEACSVPSMHEQHVYVVCQLAEGVYMLDIPYGLYEVGGGFSWAKIPDVRFTEGFLVWYRLDKDPESYAQYSE